LKPFIVIFLVCSFLISCKDSGITNDKNILLKEKIIGSWKGESGIIQFNADGSFIDSTFIRTYPTGSYKCSSDSSNDSIATLLNKVILGSYSIEDSTLLIDPLEVVTDCFPTPENKFFNYLNSKINFKNDTLQLHSFKEFERISGSHDGLKGSWETSFSALIYHSDFNYELVLLDLTERREFKVDSGFFNTSFSQPFEETTYQTYYGYEPPEFYPFLGARPVVQVMKLNSDSFTLFDEYEKSYIRK